jgi:initiation factor 1A
MLGGGRVQLQCYDGVSRQGLIRGTMRRRVWINTVRALLAHAQMYY